MWRSPCDPIVSRRVWALEGGQRFEPDPHPSPPSESISQIPRRRPRGALALKARHAQKHARHRPRPRPRARPTSTLCACAARLVLSPPRVAAAPWRSSHSIEGLDSRVRRCACARATQRSKGASDGRGGERRGDGATHRASTGRQGQRPQSLTSILRAASCDAAGAWAARSEKRQRGSRHRAACYAWQGRGRTDPGHGPVALGHV